MLIYTSCFLQNENWPSTISRWQKQVTLFTTCLSLSGRQSPATIFALCQKYCQHKQDKCTCFILSLQMPLFHLQCVQWLVYPHAGHYCLAILFQVAGMNAPSECPLCTLSWINISLGSWEEIKYSMLCLSSIIQKKYKMSQLMEAPILKSCQAQEHTKPQEHKNHQQT